MLQGCNALKRLLRLWFKDVAENFFKDLGKATPTGISLK